MPDLDGELAELRTRLRETVHQPGLDRVIERSRQRGTRRRTQLGAVAAVLVVAAAIPVLRTTMRPVADGPASPGAQSAEPSAFSPPAPANLQVEFTDARHGFALRTRCGSVPTCTNELLITEDGGDRWQLRALPDEFSHTAAKMGIRLFALGPAAAAVREINPPQDRGFFTADTGRTWVPIPPAGSETAATIPDGGTLDVACATNTAECKLTLVAVAVDSGRVLPLRTAPPLEDAIPASLISIAGGWWVFGKDPATGRRALAVSRDAGLHWSVKTLPDWPSTPLEVLMTVHGTTLYAAVGGQPPNVAAALGLIAILRSTDSGNTWEQTFVAADGREPHSMAGFPVAAADGRLILTTDSGSAWASEDGGRSFQELPGGVVSGYILRTAGGYIASASPGQSNVYKFSTDGVRWKEITIR